MDNTFVIAQLIGAIAFAVSLYGVSQSNDKRLKNYIAVAALIYALQFYLLGAMLGACLAILAAFRYWLVSITQNIILMWLFIVLYLGIAFFNPEGIIGLFLLAGNIIGTYALFRLKGTTMRYSFIVGIGSNIIYNFYYMALASIANDIINVLMHIKTIYKIKKAQKND